MGSAVKGENATNKLEHLIGPGKRCYIGNRKLIKIKLPYILNTSYSYFFKGKYQNSGKEEWLLTE